MHATSSRAYNSMTDGRYDDKRTTNNGRAYGAPGGGGAGWRRRGGRGAGEGEDVIRKIKTTIK